jgi:hypothetical protein
MVGEQQITSAAGLAPPVAAGATALAAWCNIEVSVTAVLYEITRR